MEESEAPAFVVCPYCRLELPRELIRSHVEDQHVASTLTSKKEEEKIQEKSEVKKAGINAGPPNSTANSNSKDQTRTHEVKNKNVEQPATQKSARMEVRKKIDKDPFEESLNFPQWSDSEDDPDPVEKDDEDSKQGEGRTSPEKAKTEMEKSKKLAEEAKANKDRLEKLHQSNAKPAQNQTEARAAPKTVMERLKEVERLTELEKRRAQVQMNQAAGAAKRAAEQPRINGKFAASPQTRSQTQQAKVAPPSQPPKPLEPQVALCGLCNFANPFRTTAALIAHVRRAHERAAAAHNLAEIRHRVVPAKNYPAPTPGGRGGGGSGGGKTIQGEDNQPVVDEEVARDDYC